MFLTNEKYENMLAKEQFLKIQELTLEEIQQYLPDGHVDKITKEFVLPKYWHVVVTEENKEILSKWRFTNSKYSLSVGQITGIHEFGTKEHNPICSREGFGIEITFEQFKKYVLKESVDTEVKPIEKWSVGSYVVFCKNDTGKNIILNKPYEIKEKSNQKNIHIIDEDNNINYTDGTSEYYIIKWFPTLEEAEAFSKELLEPKPLKSEVEQPYVAKEMKKQVVHCTSKEEWDFLCDKIQPGSKDVWRWANEFGYCKRIDVLSHSQTLKHFQASPGNQILSFQEWLDLNDYTFSEETSKPVDKPFEFNKWYKFLENGLVFITSETTGYGFNDKNQWFVRTEGSWALEEMLPATSSEVSEKLIAYAKEKYPVGTVIKSALKNDPNPTETTVTSIGSLDKAAGRQIMWNGSGVGFLFDDGRWAEIVSTPVEESKEFNRNWYVEVNSQEEADKVFDWLEAQGEIVDRNWNTFCSLWEYIIYVKPEKKWVLTCISNVKKGDVQKQLSEIIKGYKSTEEELSHVFDTNECLRIEIQELIDQRDLKLWVDSSKPKSLLDGIELIEVPEI